MSDRVASPQERFATASQHTALLRALYSHSQTVVDKAQRANADRSRMPSTLWNVLDFEHSTFTKYLVPLLPPNATKHSRALAEPWDYEDPNFKENQELVSDDLYPRMQAGGLEEKWQDALGRQILIANIILDRTKHIMFGGPFEFGTAFEEAARNLLPRT